MLTEKEIEKQEQLRKNREQFKKHYYARRETELMRAKRNYEANKEQYVCLCGSKFFYCNTGQYNNSLKKHLETKKHTKYINDAKLDEAIDL
jgi:hypothetical protein